MVQIEGSNWDTLAEYQLTSSLNTDNLCVQDAELTAQRLLLAVDFVRPHDHPIAFSCIAQISRDTSQLFKLN